jgi:PKHD-type hydroxylase
MSAIWAFENDHMHTYAYWTNAFSHKECKKIIELGKKRSLEKGVSVGATAEDYRSSNVAWIFPSDETNWIFSRLAEISTKLNNDFFKFDLFGLVEGLQFTEYVGEECGKYDKHMDTIFDGIVRKLSITVQLSEEDDYEGGEVILHIGSDNYTNTKDQGNLLAFPSFTLHEVRPVTKGTRYSLVAWVTGKPFK